MIRSGEILKHPSPFFVGSFLNKEVMLQGGVIIVMRSIRYFYEEKWSTDKFHFKGQREYSKGGTLYQEFFMEIFYSFQKQSLLMNCRFVNSLFTGQINYISCK